MSSVSRPGLRLWSGLFLAFALTVPAARGAESTFDVHGGCRDGLPNGAYELRAANGQLRVAGAFHMGKRTGTFIFWTERGRRVAAIPYDEGVRNGTIALWHVDSRASEPGRRLEAPVQRGRAEGVRRSWYPGGQPRTEAEYVDDRLVRIAAWDRSGRPVSEETANRYEREDVQAVMRELANLEDLVTAHPPDCSAAGSVV